jgi:hypothetical protein
MEENMGRLLNSKLYAAAGLASALATFLPAGPAGAATTINGVAVASCTTPNCSSALIIGTLTSHGSYAVPWVIQVASDPGQCVRLETTDVIGSDLNLEMVVVSPSGRVFRNDNISGTNNLSLVKIAPTEHGFYTVQVSGFNGGAAAVNFELRYGRYSSAGNPNCASPTPPLVSPSL